MPDILARLAGNGDVLQFFSAGLISRGCVVGVGWFGGSFGLVELLISA